MHARTPRLAVKGAPYPVSASSEAHAAQQAPQHLAAVAGGAEGHSRRGGGLRIGSRGTSGGAWRGGGGRLARRAERSGLQAIRERILA